MKRLLALAVVSLAVLAVSAPANNGPPQPVSGYSQLSNFVNAGVVVPDQVVGLPEFDERGVTASFAVSPPIMRNIDSKGAAISAHRVPAESGRVPFPFSNESEYVAKSVADLRMVPANLLLRPMRC
jgi:hypothetical protein